MKTIKNTQVSKATQRLLLAGFLFLNAIAFSNNGGDKLNLEFKEKFVLHSKFHSSKKNNIANKKCSFRFVNPFKKSIIPSTYIKFVLKNKKGSFLNIKIGYIS